MNLETDRLVLRGFTVGDADDLYEIFGSPIVMEYIEPPFTAEYSREFLEEFCIRDRKAFAAVLKETGKTIGYILFKEADEPEIYEIGWIFNNGFWRKGFAYEICKRLISYAFEDMRLHKIIAEGIDEKSVGLMKKLGMAQEGIQRKHNKQNGNWVDLHWYGILAEDYFCNKAKRSFNNEAYSVKFYIRKPDSERSNPERQKMKITIREIEEKDYLSLLPLWNNELGVCAVTAENIASRYNRVKDDDRYNTFVAVSDDKVVGFVSSTQSYGIASERGYMQIIGIAVKEDKQNQGIGKKLIEHTENYAREKGCYGIGLSSGMKRTAAHTFYERNGYDKGSYAFHKTLYPM